MADALADVMNNTPRDSRTHSLIGAGFEVHREIGSGFGENVCRDAFALELQMRGVPFQTEVPFPIHYKGHRLHSVYRADFVCFDAIIVEIKSLPARTGRLEQAQMLRYLRASEMTVALLLNFGLPSLEYRRFVLSDTQITQIPQTGHTDFADSTDSINSEHDH